MTEMEELLKAAQQLQEENDRLKRMYERLEVQNIRESGEKDKEIKVKEAYIEMLQTDIGRGREELLHLSEKVTEREEVINGLMIKFEGLEKMLNITAVHSLDSGTSGVSSVPSMSYVALSSMANNTSSAAITTQSAAVRTPIMSLPTSVSAGPAQVAPVGVVGSGINPTYGVKMPTFKSPGDIEVFMYRFEQYCLTQNVMIDRKTNLLLMALDEATFTVVKRELTDAERADYDTVKKHLLKRFDLLKDAGQKRLIFR